MRFRSTRHLGLASRSFSIETRLCPPDSTFASSEYSVSNAMAPCRESGRKYSKRLGIIRLFPQLFHLFRGVGDRFNNLLIAGAHAQVALQRLADLVFAGIGVQLQHMVSVHDHAG